MPYVYLSYARGDDDRYVEQFFLDLCAEVEARVAGFTSRTVGYLGSADASPADDAFDEMIDAAATCRVFVPLCSPRYFLNRACGQQLWLFQQRLRRVGPMRGRATSALLPVLWTSTVAATAADLRPARPDPRDPSRGLRQLVRLRSLRTQYYEFVRSFASAVMEAAAEAIPPFGPVPSAELIPSAFAPVDDRSPGRRSGMLGVRFVVAAGRREKMTDVRRDVAYYGDHGTDWAPFQPLRPDPLARQAAAVAADHMLACDVTDLESSRSEQRNDDIVVVLVDPWSTRVDELRRAMAEPDSPIVGADAVLVPASASDPETRANLEELAVSMRAALHENAVSQVVVHANITSPASFEADLGGVLEEAKNRLYRTKLADRSSRMTGQRQRPILQGP